MGQVRGSIKSHKLSGTRIQGIVAKKERSVGCQKGENGCFERTEDLEDCPAVGATFPEEVFFPRLSADNPTLQSVFPRLKSFFSHLFSLSEVYLEIIGEP